MLSNFYVKNRINKKFDTSGLDTLEKCLDKKHFDEYPYNVYYEYNSRGFRDLDWPEDISKSIWCIGDSFTVGIGAPVEHSWPAILSNRLAQSTINCGMDGASNDWISARVLELITELGPKNIIIQWSYLHRREQNGVSVWFDPMSTRDDDINNLCNHITKIESRKGSTNIIHSCIPFRDIKIIKILYQLIAKKIPKDTVFVELFDQLDFARDGHHYDVKTSNAYVDHYLPLLKL
jgi:hypothetical protein